MPVQVSYPGVYIQELPSDVRTIVGLSTSSTAFVDVFKRGPVGVPTRIDGFADFIRTFGGLWDYSEASYAISQYFLNGGQTAWVLRLAPSGARAASAKVVAAGGILGGYFVIEISAASEGVWGNDVEVARFVPNARGADAATPVDDSETKFFGLVVQEMGLRRGKRVPIQSEVHLDLSFAPSHPRYFEAILEHESSLVRVTGIDHYKDKDEGKPSAAVDQIKVALGLSTKQTKNMVDIMTATGGYAMLPPPEDMPTPTDDAEINSYQGERYSAALGKLPYLPLTGGKDGVSDADRTAEFEAQSAAHAEDMKAFKSAHDDWTKEKAKFDADKSKPEGSIAPTEPTEPTEPTAPAASLSAELALLLADDLNGFRQLERMSPARFNLLCLPATFKMDHDNRLTVQQAAHEFCHEQRAFFIVDGAEQPDGTKFRDDMDYSGVLEENAAVYFPHLTMADPLKANRPRKVGPSGTVAGVIARTDTERGIWKAPAGIETTLRGATPGLNVADAENGVLNELGINVLRTFPVYGSVVWGARTTDGADFESSQWKYIPVRRLALHIENSLFEGSKWVVFEPNDEPLWAQIRLSIGAFMHDLFRQGAFQGATPNDAYFVHCDKTTTTQSDIDRGIVNIVVGFAPLKPSEFVIISIQQIHPE